MYGVEMPVEETKQLAMTVTVIGDQSQRAGKN